MIDITLPWPPKALSPNARVHWSVLAKTKKQYRADCFMQARIQGAKAMQGPLKVEITFVPPDRRGRDMDNMLASCKAGLDGLADAIKVDDRHWKLSLETAPEVGGMVKLRVWETV